MSISSGFIPMYWPTIASTTVPGVRRCSMNTRKLATRMVTSDSASRLITYPLNVLPPDSCSATLVRPGW